MSCPNCDNTDYTIGTPCSDCTHYEKPEYWDLGFSAVFTGINWTVCFNGFPVINEKFSSKHEAQYKACKFHDEMSQHFQEVL